MTKQAIAIGAALAALITSSSVMAEVTANFGAASQYLWRAQGLSGAGPAVSGGVDYGHESGIYAGLWTSSEGGFASHETDAYVGFAGEVEGFSYDVGYVSYMYLQNTTVPSVDFEEVYLGLGYGPVSFSYANDSDNDATYYSLSGEYDRYSVTFGSYGFDNTPTDDYTHIDLSVALTDELSLTYSIASIDDPTNSLTNEEGFFVISYGLEFELN